MWCSCFVGVLGLVVLPGSGVRFCFSILPGWVRLVVSVSSSYFGSVLSASALLSVISPCDQSVSRIPHFSVPFRPPVTVSPSRFKSVGLFWGF